MIQLEPGDILAWRVVKDAPVIDRLIGWGERVLHEHTPQGGQYYHIAIVSPQVSMMYSSQPPKINLYPIPDQLPPWIEAYRLKQTPTALQWNAIFMYAESRRGRWYDFMGVLTAGFIEVGGLEFCSKFTEDSFANGQVVLSGDIEFPTPDDIVSSPLLYRL